MKKFTCFVCREKFNTKLELNTHIKASHDEGREYIICPLQRCQDCILDIRHHFKCHHKHEPIPKNIQMKAMIYKTVDKKGNVKVRKGFKEGFFKSVKNGKEIHYRSNFECSFYKMLELLDTVASYEAEPFKIPYFFKGRSHHYIPDILVTMKNGKKELWEVKPKVQTKLPKNQAKWVAAHQYCTVRGMRFIVCTEKKLQLITEDVKRQNNGG